ncbi:MAG: hypothetical protein V2B18_25590 [Pseudomonadota bacterium]
MAEWTRSRFVNEYIPGLETVMVDSYLSKRAESMWPKLVTTKTSKKKKEEDTLRSRLGLPLEKGEGAGITYDVQIAGAKQAWIHTVYALGVRITEEAVEDNLYELGGGGNADDVQELYADLGDSMARNVEVVVSRLLTSATATTYHTTRNSAALLSTTHSRLDGSTFSNYLTATDLTPASFWAAVIAAENQLDHRQARVEKRVKNLWIPPQLEKKAREILYSTDAPDTANRAINAYKQSGRNISLNKWAYLTDADGWFLQCDGIAFKFYWRRKTRFAREGDFQTGDIQVKGDQRFSVEIDDEREILGNVPA